MRLIVSETTNENNDVSFTLEIYGCRLNLDTNTFGILVYHFYLDVITYHHYYLKLLRR